MGNEVPSVINYVVVYAYNYLCMYVYICMYVCMYIFVCVYVCADVYAHCDVCRLLVRQTIPRIHTLCSNLASKGSLE